MAGLPPDPALQRAAVLFGAGRLDEARDIALGLLAAQPESFLALHLLGAIAVRAGRAEECIDYETRALAVHPGDAEALCNRGIGYRMLGRIDEALADYDRVLASRPAFAPALNLKGVALAALNRHAEAIACYSQALAAVPGLPAAHFNRSLSELVLGDFERGWPDFEWRWKGSDTQIPMREFGKPQWRGEDPRGRTILVHAEQGLGDAIQLCRYVPLLAARGANVVLEVQPALASLMAPLPARLLAFGEPWPAFDWHCPIMSLPLAFGTRADSIPAAVPYLGVDPGTLRERRARWEPGSGLRVGFAWSGSTTLRNDANRSIPLAAFAPLMRRPWRLVALKKEVRESDRDALAASGIEWLADSIADFRDTAAIVSQLDLVVTVDTAVAHLAGALGKPVWILLPFAPDWRWLLDRDDSPWYPTARLFRQARPGEWAPVIARVAEALGALAA